MEGLFWSRVISKSLLYEVFCNQCQPFQILPSLNLDKIFRHTHTILSQLNMGMIFDFLCTTYLEWETLRAG